MTVVLAVLLPVVLAYQGWTHHVFRGRLRGPRVGSDEPGPVIPDPRRAPRSTEVPVSLGGTTASSPTLPPARSGFEDVTPPSGRTGTGPGSWLIAAGLVFLAAWLFLRQLFVNRTRPRRSAHVPRWSRVDPSPISEEIWHQLGPRACHRPTQMGYQVAGWWADPRAAAVAEALIPYDWRGFTERMLARRVVGAVDRYTVLRIVSRVPGASVGGLGPVDPADLDDPRVDPLVSRLESRQWRGFSLDRVCADLISALAVWQTEWDSSGRGPHGMVDDR